MVADQLRLTVGLRLLALSCLCCCFTLVRISKVSALSRSPYKELFEMNGNKRAIT